MFSLLLSSAASYRICPNKIPYREDLYYEKTVKGEHWSYFTVKLNATQFFMYLNISATGNTSFYLGRNNRCPYKNDKPFLRVGPVNNKYVWAVKRSTDTFPIGIYAEEESKVRVAIDPISFEFDVALYAKWGSIIGISLFVVIQFARAHIPFAEMFSTSNNRRRRSRKNK